VRRNRSTSFVETLTTRAAARKALCALLLAVTLGGCDEVDAPFATSGGRFPVTLELVADGLSQPVFVTAAPGDARRLFVVEQTGRIRVIRDGVLLTQPFLDLSGLVSTGGERGLLGLAFSPAYAANGWFFVSYTNGAGDTRVVRYAVSSDSEVADPGSALDILVVAQPYANHNGGMLAFGPRDQLLYVGLGDGGGSGDPDNQAQNLGTLLGAMLRIDVAVARPAEPYRVPLANPLVGQSGARPEIWAYGLRNPWRFSFDLANGDMYVADVGQNAWEEVSVLPWNAPGGQNLGWPRTEGTRCFRPSVGCNTTGLTRPVYEYGRSDGCSITGGYVYRGSAIPSLRGRYLFSDFCAGWVRSFQLDGERAMDLRTHATLAPGGNVTSFGQDNAGELYIVTHAGGVYRIAPR